MYMTIKCLCTLNMRLSLGLVIFIIILLHSFFQLLLPYAWSTQKRYFYRYRVFCLINWHFWIADFIFIEEVQIEERRVPWIRYQVKVEWLFFVSDTYLTKQTLECLFVKLKVGVRVSIWATSEIELMPTRTRK